MGAVIGSYIGNSTVFTLSELYVLQQVTVDAYEQSGGMIGTYFLDNNNTNSSLSNSYSKATVICNSSDCGGILGLIREFLFRVFL